MAFLSSPPPKLGALHNDTQLAAPPDDSISSLAWSPAANYLAVGSWDNKVRIYDVTSRTTGVGVAAIDFGGPVLSSHWSRVGSILLSMSNIDKTVG
jgi:mRNA export factor